MTPQVKKTQTKSTFTEKRRSVDAAVNTTLNMVQVDVLAEIRDQTMKTVEALD